MGWLIKTKETKTQTKYKIWSTIIDSYITSKWMSKEEIIKLLFWHRLNNFVEKFLEDSMTFPNGYTEKDGNRIHMPDDCNEYNQLIQKSFQNGDVLFEKFLDEINKINIKFSIKDDKYEVEN